MTKELIANLREQCGHDSFSVAGCANCESADLIEAQQRELRVKDLTIGQMANDMAASQAQIKVLLEALETCEWVDSIKGGEYIYDEPLVKAALATPTDTTALREMLKAERERIKTDAEKCRYHALSIIENSECVGAQNAANEIYEASVRVLEQTK